MAADETDLNLKQVQQEVLEEEDRRGSEVIQDSQALKGSKVKGSTCVTTFSSRSSWACLLVSPPSSPPVLVFTLQVRREDWEDGGTPGLPGFLGPRVHVDSKVC